MELDPKALNHLMVSRLQRYVSTTSKGTARAKPLTRREIAASAGVSRSTVSNVLGEKQLLSVEMLYRLCYAFGIGVEEILPGVAELGEVDAGELASLEEDADTIEIAGKRENLPEEWAAAVREVTGEP